MSRRKNKTHLSRIIIVAAAVIGLAVALTSLDKPDMTVDAASLKHIDEIVAASGTFNILEIVPDTAGASIGYYINDEEPTQGWIDTLRTLASPSERSSYVNDLFMRLSDRGVLSSAGTTPLRQTYYNDTTSSYYSEAYLVDDPEAWQTLQLGSAEYVDMTGTFTEAEDGAYRADYIYNRQDGGGYVQDISYFEYNEAPDYSSGTYYYDPVFTPITAETDLVGIESYAVYETDDDGVYIINPEQLTIGDVIDAGGFDVSDPEDPTHYYVDPEKIGAPGEYSYAAVPPDGSDYTGDGFTQPSEGDTYFTRAISGFTYVGTGGDYAYDEAGTETWAVRFTSVYYKAGYVNNNLFKENIFGLSDATLGQLAVTVTVRAPADVSADDIAAADLVYISTGTDITVSGAQTYYSTPSGLSDTAAVALYNYAAKLYPVVIDYAVIEGLTQATPDGDIDLLERLCLLILQPELTETEETSLSALAIDWSALSYMSADIDKTFVNNNIYCFDPFNLSSVTGTPEITALVSDRFNDTDAFSSEVYQEGFSAVLSEIENENFLREIAGETDLLPETVTVSSSVRHVINYRGQRAANPKTAITVLDLEPAKVTSATWLTPQMVSDWTDGELSTDQITVVHMTTGEFIGKIEDMGETYDVVYIGASTEAFNTYSGAPVYNDGAMNGLIYSNIGDVYYATLEMAGIRAQDYVDVDGTLAIDGTYNSTANRFRFSGNDISAVKVADIQRFAQAGYPIVLADALVSGGAVNTGTVDSSSYLYRALTSVYGTYDNAFSRTAAAGDAETFLKYLNVSKPTLEFFLDGDTIVKPIEYNNPGSTALQMKDGSYYLEYGVIIGNVTDPTPITTTYDCRLFIDANADGRYSAGERLGGLVVIREADGARILPLTDEDGNEYYALTADIPYRVMRELPTDYVGIVPWKLSVIKNGAEHIHASEEGFTRVSGGKQTVNVLQIMQSGTYNTRLNLALQQNVNPGGSNSQLLGSDGQYYTGIYGKLIADLEDFNVNITAIENDDLEALGDAATISNYFRDQNYDMLIIGFNDCYDGIGEDAADAIVSFIDSGKSVLFTHDTTSLSQVPSRTYPMAVSGAAPNSITLDDTDIVWNAQTNEYKSIDGNIDWYGSDSQTSPPNLKQEHPTYVVFTTYDVSSGNENDYYNARAGWSGNYEIYRINDINSTSSISGAQITNVYSGTSLSSFKSAHPGTIVYVYVAPGDADGWYRSNGKRYDVSATYQFTKFVGSTRYTCSDLTYQYDNNKRRPRDAYTLSSNDYYWLVYCLAMDNTPDDYSVVGSYNGSVYSISGTTYYPPATGSFPHPTLYDSDPSGSYELSTIPSNISDWGYYFNTVIRDAAGLDRYGVTNPTLRDIVDNEGTMTPGEIGTVLAANRGVAFAPRSGRSVTVDEYQGYSNYALIRFAAGGNSYNYTNNNYRNRSTTLVSQVNKGQITSYPYNVNTADFGGTDSTITGYGDTFMKIGLTHEQYFQINMNTDDIVVWYCMSGGNDGNSYFDDVPNDCVNAYYIFNKGNVTYSGVGHSSSASLYTGSNIGAEYVNEAKLFVNTMIAAYSSGLQAPSVYIKKDAAGVENMSVKYFAVDDSGVDDGTTILAQELGATDETRAVYFRISDLNIGVGKSISVEYYIADPDGDEVAGIDEPVSPLVGDDEKALVTYTSGGEVAESIRSERLYKFFIPDANALDRLAVDDVNSFRIYVKVTTVIGSEPRWATDYLDVRKLQLFPLA